MADPRRVVLCGSALLFFSKLISLSSSFYPWIFDFDDPRAFSWCTRSFTMTWPLFSWRVSLTWPLGKHKNSRKFLCIAFRSVLKVKDMLQMLFRRCLWLWAHCEKQYTKSYDQVAMLGWRARKKVAMLSWRTLCLQVGGGCERGKLYSWWRVPQDFHASHGSSKPRRLRSSSN